MKVSSPKNPAPWWADLCDDVIVIRDRDGFAVCAMPRADDVNARLDQETLAELIAMSPELFCCLRQMADMVRRCDAELIRPPEDFTLDVEYDGALDDAQALIDLLEESGVALEPGV